MDYDIGDIDAEAGIPVSGDAVDNFGRPQGPNEGTGEGSLFRRSPKTERYAQLGGAIMRAQQASSPNLIQSGPVTAGFDQNWLSEQEMAGSANGAHL